MEEEVDQAVEVRAEGDQVVEVRAEGDQVEEEGKFQFLCDYADAIIKLTIFPS